MAWGCEMGTDFGSQPGNGGKVILSRENSKGFVSCAGNRGSAGVETEGRWHRAGQSDPKVSEE